jgi:hypothetical protein
MTKIIMVNPSIGSLVEWLGHFGIQFIVATKPQLIPSLLQSF